MPSEPAPPDSDVSIVRMFAVSLVLPFAHPLRLAIASLLPAILIAWLFLGPLSDVMVLWQGFFAGMNGATGTDGAPLSAPAGLAREILLFDLGLLAAVALWLCTWQRAAAHGFREPLMRWLGGALLRLPEYILAFVLWMLVPLLALFIGGAVVGFVAQLGLRNQGFVPGTPPGETLRMMLDAFPPAALWVLGAVILCIALLAFWLGARLLPLPALAASQGLRRAFQAWRLTRGHGLGISLSLFGFMLLSMAAASGVSIVIIGVLVARGGMSPDPRVGIAIGFGLELLVSALNALWQGTLGALLVHENVTAMSDINPAMFD